MCGHVGVAGKVTYNEEKMFKQMLHLDVLRGVHSTGVAAIGASDDKIIKQVGGPIDLFDMKSFENLMLSRHNVLIGHNRAATKGKVNKANAHPFSHGDIVGAHNGTLKNQRLLPDHNDFGTDSENIIHSLDTKGVDWTIENLDGAFALVWYNRKDSTINLIRNDERPLCYAYSKDRKSFFWASEAWMMTVAANRCGIELGNIYSLNVGRHLEIQIPLVSIANNCKELNNIKVNARKFYEAPTKKNYTPVGNNRNTSFSGSSHTVLRDMLNKTIKFIVTGQGSNSTKTHYFSARSIRHTPVDLRIHTPEKSSLGSMLKDFTKYFVGTPKKISYEKGKPYLTVDIRSVSEVVHNNTSEEKKGASVDITLGYDLTPLNRKEFENAVKGGCGNCCDIPTFEDSEDIEWISKDNYLCPDCANDDHLKKVIGLAV